MDMSHATEIIAFVKCLPIMAKIWLQ